MKPKEFLEEYKTVIILISIICLLIGLNIYAYSSKETAEPEIKIEEKSDEKEIKKLKIDLKGEVKHPGVYEATDDKRIIDIINKAGGLTKNADTTIINLSKKIKDEMVIIIYSKEETKKLKVNKEEKVECPKVNDACTGSEKLETLVPSKETKETETKTSDRKISLNKATSEELQTLTGIGEAKAKAIISYRTEKGAFKTIEEIKNISGIGEAVFEKIKNNITL